MFSTWYSWKIFELTLNNNHRLDHSIRSMFLKLILIIAINKSNEKHIKPQCRNSSKIYSKQIRKKTGSTSTPLTLLHYRLPVLVQALQWTTWQGLTSFMGSHVLMKCFSHVSYLKYRRMLVFVINKSGQQIITETFFFEVAINSHDAILCLLTFGRHFRDVKQEPCFYKNTAIYTFSLNFPFIVF